MTLSRQYLYVRSRQLEGTYPGDPWSGTWLITGARVMRGWGLPPETAWPYQGNAESWPPQEPPGIDQLARGHRITSYQRVRDLEEGRRLLAAGRIFPASFNIVPEDWWHAPDGTIPAPDSDAAPTAAHTIDIVGYDDATGRLTFSNSWGSRWGADGYGTVSYDFFDRYLNEAWTISSVDGDRPATASGIVEREWGQPDLLGEVLHGAEYHDAGADEHLAWAFAVARDGFLDVEELFVRPDARGRGYGRGLARLMMNRAERLRLPIRFWIPHVDSSSSNLSAVARTTRPLGLHFEDSPAAWAAHLLVG